ncbi:hypothetical protein ACLESO_15730 [Pyxidicoccus sp. 3LG]
MLSPSGSTTRKLLLAFGALVALFTAASGFALARLTDIHAGSHALREAGGRVRDALELATAVRDQYAHLAHTIILGNASHVRFHDEARARVEALTRRLREQAQDAQERTWVADIQENGDALDRLYRDTLLPAVLAKDQAAVTAAHGRALELVSHIQARADSLARRFDTSIGPSRSTWARWSTPASGGPCCSSAGPRCSPWAWASTSATRWRGRWRGSPRARRGWLVATCTPASPRTTRASSASSRRSSTG